MSDLTPMDELLAFLMTMAALFVPLAMAALLVMWKDGRKSGARADFAACRSPQPSRARPSAAPPTHRNHERP